MELPRRMQRSFGAEGGRPAIAAGGSGEEGRVRRTVIASARPQSTQSEYSYVAASHMLHTVKSTDFLSHLDGACDCDTLGLCELE